MRGEGSASRQTIHHFESIGKSRLRDGVERGELGDSSGSSSDPAEDVDFGRICEGVGKTVGDDLEDSVSGEVAVIVDVGFKHDAIDTVEVELIVFVEDELDIGFAELDLLPAPGSSRMKEARGVFDGEFPGSR
jgi:hypothetical protein